MLGHPWLALSDRVVFPLPALLLVLQAERQMACVVYGVCLNCIPLMLFITHTKALSYFLRPAPPTHTQTHTHPQPHHFVIYFHLFLSSFSLSV